MPNFAHSRLQIKLGVYIDPWSEANLGWTQAEQRCILEAGGETHTVLPDVAWWSNAQLPGGAEGPVQIPPTLAVEILSPDDRYMDVVDKVSIYINAGVKVVWVIDP